jgi:hypothetical protein
MKKFNLLVTATSLMLLSISPLSLADNKSHLEQVDKLFNLTQMEKKIDESVDSVLQLQLRQNPQLAKHSEEMRKFFTKYIGWDALKVDLATMYMETFTEDELKTINDFYVTPAGQKVINSLPQLVQQRNQLAMQRLQQNIGELQKIIAPPAPAATP